MKKKDLDRLKRLVASWKKESQEMQRLYGEAVRGSIGDMRNKDCAALAEAIKFIEEVKHDRDTTQSPASSR